MENYKYNICIKEKESYIVIAETDMDAFIKAIDLFKDDDMYYDMEETENVTTNNCKIIWKEEVE